MTGETKVSCDTTAYNTPWNKQLNQGVTTLVKTTPNLVLEVTNVFQAQVTFGKGSIITLRCGKLRNPRTLTQTADGKVEVFSPASTTVAVTSNSFKI